MLPLSLFFVVLCKTPSAMKFNLSKLEGNILSCFKLHWVEAMLGICFFVMFLLPRTVVHEKESVEVLENIVYLFPLFFALAYTCNRLFIGKLRLLYYLSLFFFVPLLFIDLSQFIFSISYGFTLLLAFFLLLVNKGRQDNMAFARDSIQTVIHLIVSLFIGHVMALAVCAIIGSLIYIFDLECFDLLQYSYFFALFIVTPMTFCHLQDTEFFADMPRFMDIIITYILSPAVIIYTGILYLYFITITIHWELPKGKIGYMVLAFVIFALGGRMAQLLVSRRYYDWFYHYFSFIAIPPLIIFWVGTVERIATYSFTVSRVYLLAAGILMSLYILLLLSKRFGRYQLMLAVSICCIVALTYIPGISAKSIGIYAQEARLEKYIVKLDALDAATHKLKADFTGLPDSEEKNVSELQESYRYLVEEVGKAYVEEKYGICNLPFGFKWESISLEGGVNVEGYTYYQPFISTDYYFNMREGVLTIIRNKDQEPMLVYDISKRLNEHPDLLTEDNGKQQELLIWKTEKYLLVLDNISYEKMATGGYRCTNAYPKAIFSGK